MSRDFVPSQEYANAAEASAIALEEWFRHQRACGECLSVPFGGRICEMGRGLINAHQDAVHEEIHAELRALGKAVPEWCGECQERERSNDD